MKRIGLSFFKNSLIKHTAIYTITDGVSKGLAFLTLPLISHYLIPEELGIAANFDVLQNILMLLAGQAVVNAMPYFYYGKTKHEQAEIVSAMLTIVLVSNVLFAALIFLFTGILEEYLHIGLLLQLLTIVSVVAHLTSSLSLILFRLEEKPYSFACLQIIKTVIYLSLLVLLVVEFRMSALGKILGAIISYSVVAIIHLILLIRRKYIVLSFKKGSIIKLLKFGLPLLPHSLSFWFKSGFDKVIITSFCGLAINGIYSMALSFGAVYTIFNHAFSSSYVPYLQKRISKFSENDVEKEKKKLVFFSYKIMSGFAILTLFVIIFCWVAVKYILDSQYADSFQFIPWIMIGLTFHSMYGLVVQFPYSVKKTFGLGVITFSGSIIQLLLTYVLVSSVGIDGIKISYVVGSFIIMIGVWIYSNRVYPMPWFSVLNKLTNKNGCSKI